MGVLSVFFTLNSSRIFVMFWSILSSGISSFWSNLGKLYFFWQRNGDLKKYSTELFPVYDSFSCVRAYEKCLISIFSAYIFVNMNFFEKIIKTNNISYAIFYQKGYYNFSRKKHIYNIQNHILPQVQGGCTNEAVGLDSKNCDKKIFFHDGLKCEKVLKKSFKLKILKNHPRRWWNLEYRGKIYNK